MNDRQNNRVQVFTLEGRFVKEGFIYRDTRSNFGTSFSLAFSADKDQRFLYVADLANFRVEVLDRQSLISSQRLRSATPGLIRASFCACTCWLRTPRATSTPRKPTEGK